MSVYDDALKHAHDILTAIKEGRYREALTIAPKFLFALIAVLVVLVGVGFGSYHWIFSNPKPTTELSSKSTHRKILVIGPETGGEEDTWRYIREGVEAARNKMGLGQLDEGLITIEYKNDKSNPDWAGELARKICSDQDYVLALGFVQSGVAERHCNNLQERSVGYRLFWLQPRVPS
jgi:ABC-type branched-subunit amino acid transport system substrate-binding protein